LCFCSTQFIVHLLLLRAGMRADVNVVLPIRQTASIFKQPVTIVSNHPESKTRTDLRHGTQEQPRQVTYDSGVSSHAPLPAFAGIFAMLADSQLKMLNKSFLDMSYERSWSWAHMHLKIRLMSVVNVL